MDNQDFAELKSIVELTSIRSMSITLDQSNISSFKEKIFEKKDENKIKEAKAVIKALPIMF